ncbi:GNAT family N-acetyltransferase [Bacillus massiliigorillae]|uniref:GNAT family N-acetyltransferase n=1 Tax=Bacillus massiliigorillae TaxID=1243664 RepID=UPI0003A1452D|nr:GNAT family protein [Bacillus massiliigorillae]
MEIGTVYEQLPILETDRLLLRKITLQDAEDMFEYTSNPTVSKYVSWEPHRSLTDTRGYIHFVLQQYTLHRLAPWGIELKENNKLIGTINFVAWQPRHKTAEIGYALSELYWNKGFITEAAQAVLSFGFTKMNTIRIEARCLSDNIASQRVMEKNGMTLEGTIRKGLFIKGKHRDIKLYSILKDEFEATHPIC